MAEHLIGSEVLKISGEIRALVAQGRQVCNLTVGDYSSAQFRIPRLLEEELLRSIAAGETTYPPSDGMLSLRAAVVRLYEQWLGLRYGVESVLITGGSRPSIYAVYRALVDPGDTVVYPVPSWNNNHYCHLVGASPVPVVCGKEEQFLPTRSMLAKAVRGARLLSVNSPLNPAGTAFSRDALEGICDLVLEENRRRVPGERPLYLLYDQVYWMLTFGATRHENPVSLRPELAPYTFFIDGVSKSLAATGLRVGWTVGPADIVARMGSILGHVGAWAPRAEQVAVAAFLGATDEVSAFLRSLKEGLELRLEFLASTFAALRAEGFPVEAVAPAGAIYLSARFDLIGKSTPAGDVLRTNEDIRRYILNAAGVAVVPFQAFGLVQDSGWFRLSVGAVSVDDLRQAVPGLRTALQALR
jgi:aspartate aminotransferase